MARAQVLVLLLVLMVSGGETITLTSSKDDKKAMREKAAHAMDKIKSSKRQAAARFRALMEEPKRLKEREQKKIKIGTESRKRVGPVKPSKQTSPESDKTVTKKKASNGM